MCRSSAVVGLVVQHRVARLTLLGPNFRNLVPNNICWPQKFPFALWLFFSPFQDRLDPCKIYIWPRGFLSEKPCFFIFWLINCRFSPNSYILKVFDCKILLRSLQFELIWKLISSSECLLLAAVVEVAARTVTLPNLLNLGGARACWFCSDCCCRVLFKENVRYPVWTFRDPIFLILGTRFSLILRTRWSFSLILGPDFQF